MQGEARLRGLFPTKRHPCWSVVSVPIRVLFRLPGQSPPARNAHSNGDPINQRLSAIAYRLRTALGSPGRSPPARTMADYFF